MYQINKARKLREKIEIFRTNNSRQNITNIVDKAVDVASTEEDLNKVTEIVENSKGTLANKTIDSANKRKLIRKKFLM